MVLGKGRKEAIPTCMCPSYACTQLGRYLRGGCKSTVGSTSIRDRSDCVFDHRARTDGSLHCIAPQLLVEKDDQRCKTHRSWSQSIQTGFPPSLLQSLSRGYEGTSQYVVGTGSHRSCTSMNACTVGTALRCSEGTHPGTCGRTAMYTAVRRLLLCSRYQTLVCTPPNTKDRRVFLGTSLW